MYDDRCTNIASVVCVAEEGVINKNPFVWCPAVMQHLRVHTLRKDGDGRNGIPHPHDT